MLLDRIKNERNFEPFVYYCAIDKNIKQGTKHGPVKRDVFLIETCVRGGGKIIINDKEFHIGAGSAYFLFPGDIVKHVNDEPKTREGYFCSVDGIQMERVLKRVGITSDSPFAPPRAFDEINAHMKELYLTRDDSDPGADMRRTAHIYSILGALLKECEQTPKNYWLSKVIGFIETNYHTDISVAKLASVAGLERAYFSTRFKSEMGISPYSYLTELRIKKAKALIAEKNFTIGEIAFAVGLEPQNFARIFQRETGISPSRYRDQAYAKIK